jgi:hypothetical protein
MKRDTRSSLEDRAARNVSRFGFAEAARRRLPAMSDRLLVERTTGIDGVFDLSDRDDGGVAGGRTATA